MNDADLLDLLEILENLSDANRSSLMGHHDRAEGLFNNAQTKISSFRTAIRQRMIASQGEP